MPKGVKKQAKLAHKSKKVDAEEQAASRLVMLSGDHRVSKNVTGRTDCGERVVGWRYGGKEDVKCWGCLTPDERVPLIEVPPDFPVVGKHHANDGESIPILCYECGEEWPCPVVVAAIPILDVGEFEGSQG